MLIVAAAIIAVAGLRVSSARSDDKPSGHSIASCDMDQLVWDLMRSDKYDQRLKKEYDARKAESKELYDEMMKKYNALKDAPETGPDRDRLDSEYDEAYEKYTKHREEWSNKHEKLWMELTWEAFSEAKQAAVRTATDHGYAYVLNSDTTDEPFTTSSMSRFHYERGARRVLLAPDGTDITDDVRDALRVQKAPKQVKDDTQDN